MLEEGCLGAAFGGLTDLVLKSEPTALSKNPPEAGLLEAGCLGAAFGGVTDLFPNSEATALSKKPFELPAMVNNHTNSCRVFLSVDFTQTA